ncbi:hypothetical protein KY084_10150 [Stakelama sp. CBK3Z-3]|uniref:DUF4440 domain-containing protein n=1 Tax=Stakelama flava TaxID=2860338 RepID=A0ABS6XLZ8_9SPHN|nr:hypothetical protein [Stakelama flava]MBW4331232.1 hypothetical protein [Stakelama flava]
MPPISARSTLFLALPALLLAGCEVRDAPADNAQGNSDPSAANDSVTLTENVIAPADMNALPPAEVNAVGPSNVDDSALINAQMPEPAAGNQGTSTAAAARSAVQRYYALISAADYDHARALWDDDGQAAQRSADEFARRFDRYSSYQADIGEAGAVRSEKNDRYVTVPVTLHGTLRDGASAFRTKAKVILHRKSGSGDTAGWRIARIETPQGATGG